MPSLFSRKPSAAPLASKDKPLPVPVASSPRAGSPALASPPSRVRNHSAGTRASAKAVKPDLGRQRSLEDDLGRLAPHSSASRHQKGVRSPPPASAWKPAPLGGHLGGSGMISGLGEEEIGQIDYGYAPEGLDVTLEPRKVEEIVHACAHEIRARGLDSPLIFSSMALDLSATTTVSLIRSYLYDSSNSIPLGSQTSLGRPSPAGKYLSLPNSFAREIRFANPHDLAAVIKWALGRMCRVLPVPVGADHDGGGGKSGKDIHVDTVFVQQRGCLDAEVYMAWREEERMKGYRSTSYTDFAERLPLPVSSLLSTLFSLLSSTTSYSLKNGMTPSKLARHLGSLLFGLPEDETFVRTYDAYLRASNATEHLLLAYIRDQSYRSSLPIRLLDHIKGYPAMLASELAQPSKHTRTVPVTQIERTVRLYSADLVQTACQWDVPGCEEWEACRGDEERYGKDPQLSDRFRRLINYRGGILGRKEPSAAAKVQRSRSSTATDELDSDPTAAYRSLVDKQWNEFALGGFSSPDVSKLAFDLNENKRKERQTKRRTMEWGDFTVTGFGGGDGDETLNAELNFDPTLRDEMDNWPTEREELMRQLRKTEKKLPPFPYDTTPRVVASPTRASQTGARPLEHPISAMDEVFAEAWADYFLGGGWGNVNELTHRSASFAVLQFKSRRSPGINLSRNSANGRSSANLVTRRDEFGQTIQPETRVESAWFVVQETVPSEYRANLEQQIRNRGKAFKKLNVFKTMKKPSGKPFDGPAGGLTGAGSSNWTLKSRHTEQELDQVFRPGPGGTTKRIHLSEKLTEPPPSPGLPPLPTSPTALTSATASPPLSDNATASRDPRGKGIGGTLASRYTLTDSLAPMPIAAEDEKPEASDVPLGSGPSNLKSENSILAAIRNRRLKARAGVKGDGLDRSSAMAGGIQSGFHPLDFETRSLHDDELGVLHGDDKPLTIAQKAQRRLSRHGRQESKDDAWIDIMLRTEPSRASGQDAEPSAPPASRRDKPSLPPAAAVGEGNGQAKAAATKAVNVEELADAMTTTTTRSNGVRDHAPAEHDGDESDFEPIHGLESASEAGPASPTSPPSVAAAPLAPEPIALAPKGTDERPPATAEAEIAARTPSPHMPAVVQPPREPSPPAPAPKTGPVDEAQSPPRSLSPREEWAERARLRNRDPPSPTDDPQAKGGPSANLTPQRSSVLAGTRIPVRTGERDPEHAARIANIINMYGGKGKRPQEPVQEQKQQVPPPAAAGGKVEKELPKPSPAQEFVRQIETDGAGTDSGATSPVPAAPAAVPRPDTLTAPSTGTASMAGRDSEESEGPSRASIVSTSTMSEEELREEEQQREWRRLERVEAEGEDTAMEMHGRFVPPYQPGMPLANVDEESESVVSA